MSGDIARQEIELRALGEEAVPQLLDLYRQCEEFLALGPESRASEEMVRRDLETSQPYGGSYRGIFDASGRLLGVLDVIPDEFEGEAGTAFIELLMVAAPYRRLGIGKSALAMLYAELRGRQVHWIKAAVQVNNLLARRFWEREGFRAVSGPEPQPDGTVTVMMVCELW